MKVLHVIPSVAAVRGGPSPAALSMVQHLAQKGADVMIATTNDNGPDLLDVPTGEHTLYRNTPVLFFDRFSPRLPAIREFTYSNGLRRWLNANIAAYDIVHVHALFSWPCTYAMMLARRRGVPYLNRPLGLLCEWSLQQKARKKRLYLSLIERRNLNGAAGLEFTAELEKEEARPLGLQAPGFILPFGLDPEPVPDRAGELLRAKLGIVSDEPIILFLSRLHVKKGIDYLIRGLAALRHRRFTLLVAGSGEADYEAEVRELASSSGLGDRIRFLGFADGAWKQLLLAGSDLFALTSHSESFGLAVLEALIVGTPVIITPGVPLASLVSRCDVGWVPEMEHQAIVESLTQALDALDNSAGMVARRERAAHLVRENLTWERAAERIILVYDAILSGRPLPSFGLDMIHIDTVI